MAGLAGLASVACGATALSPVAHPPAPTTASRTATTTVDPAPAAPADTTAIGVMVPGANAHAPFDTPRTLRGPAGSSVEVWARVSGARFETLTPTGDLLVSASAEGKILRLHPGIRPSDPPRISTVLSGLSSPQGLAFDHVEGTTILYVVEADRVERYRWTGTGVGAAKVIATLPGPASSPSYDHPLKNVVVGPDHTVYVDVASSADVAPADRTASPPRAVIDSFPPDGGGGTLVAQGVRNGDGLAFAPDGKLWTAVNERDDIAEPNGRVDQSYVNDHPPDELAVVGGARDLGWPYCNPVQGPGPDPYGSMALQPDAQTNRDGRALDCSTLSPIERGIPAHSAPLGLTFLEGSGVPRPWRDGAVIGAHGSNDHVPPKPGAVLWAPWRGSTLGPTQGLLEGFLSPGRDRWGKPVDAVAGADGAVYISDDKAGAIYRMVLPSAG